MKPITIIYGSSSGNTQSVAKDIKEKLAMYDVNLLDVAKASAKDVEAASNLILGTSTWGVGELQDDWDSFLPVLKKCALDDKTITLFGLGDSASYSDTFVDGIGIIYDAIKDKNCKITGQTPVDGYDFRNRAP
ncbi:MAG: flavodoxin domain-containing protein [Breznakibacter sp.]